MCHTRGGNATNDIDGFEVPANAAANAHWIEVIET